MSQKFHSRFVKPPRHPFDIERIRQTTEAVNASRNLQIYVGQKAAIHQSDSNTLIELPPNTPKIDKVSNFQIYNIDNATDPTKNNFTFQIRPGIIGFRPAYFPYGFAQSNDFSNVVGCMLGNWEFPLVGTGTENSATQYYPPPYPFSYSGYSDPFDSYATPYPNQGGSVVIPNTGAATLITSTNPSAFNSGVQIEIEPLAPDVHGNQYYVYFWLLIKEDSANGCYTELWGQASGRGFGTVAIFPSGAQGVNAIPLGFIFWGDIAQSSAFGISQVQTGNAIGNMRPINPALIPHGSYPEVNEIPQNWRGKNSIIPIAFSASGNDYRVYYPGDVITDDSAQLHFASGTGVSNLTNYYKQYICTFATSTLRSSFTGGNPFQPFGYAFAS